MVEQYLSNTEYKQKSYCSNFAKKFSSKQGLSKYIGDWMLESSV